MSPRRFALEWLLVAEPTHPRSHSESKETAINTPGGRPRQAAPSPQDRQSPTLPGPSMRTRTSVPWGSEVGRSGRSAEPWRGGRPQAGT